MKAGFFVDYGTRKNSPSDPFKTFCSTDLRYKEVLDGIQVDIAGNCWIAGPGGLFIISPAGKLLGRIDTGEIVSNCAWGDDGRTLYIAMFLYRIKTSVKGNM